MEGTRRKTQCQWTPRVYHLINQAAALRLIKNAPTVQWMGREHRVVNLVYRVVSLFSVWILFVNLVWWCIESLSVID